MVRSRAVLIAAVATLALVAGCQAPTPELNLVMTDYAFEPKQLSLTPGQRAVSRRGVCMREDSGRARLLLFLRETVAADVAVTRLRCLSFDSSVVRR